MKKTIELIVRGYGEIAKNVGAVLLILSAFLGLAFLIGYPLWFIATNYPDLYTDIVVIAAGGALLLAAVLGLKRLYREKGFQGIGGSIRRIGKILFFIY